MTQKSRINEATESKINLQETKMEFPHPPTSGCVKERDPRIIITSKALDRKQRPRICHRERERERDGRSDSSAHFLQNPKREKKETVLEV